MGMCIKVDYKQCKEQDQNWKQAWEMIQNQQCEIQSKSVWSATHAELKSDAQKQHKDKPQSKSSRETLFHVPCCSEPWAKYDSAVWCCSPKSTRWSWDRWIEGLINMPAKKKNYLICLISILWVCGWFWSLHYKKQDGEQQDK